MQTPNSFDRFYRVKDILVPIPDCAVVAFSNPLSGPDHELAAWFHARLTQPLADALGWLSGPGSAVWIGFVLACAVLLLAWRKRWGALAMLVLAVPCGMLLNELLKLAVQRQRPFIAGPFVDWSGYSFASGHTIGATLLYGWLAVCAAPAIRDARTRMMAIAAAASLIVLVGFSRIALGAHYLTDVLAAMTLGSLWLAACVMMSRAVRRSPLPGALPSELPPATVEISPRDSLP